MRDKHLIVNSALSLKRALDETTAAFAKDRWVTLKICSGKRTLRQNALKSVWYGEIADFRGDVTEKEVERECKYKYGLPIIRRDPGRDYVHAKLTDELSYEDRIKIMDCFAVTSIMTVNELNEYLSSIRSDYTYLSNEMKLSDRKSRGANKSI